MVACRAFAMLPPLPIRIRNAKTNKSREPLGRPFQGIIFVLSSREIFSMKWQTHPCDAAIPCPRAMLQKEYCRYGSSDEQKL